MPHQVPNSDAYNVATLSARSKKIIFFDSSEGVPATGAVAGFVAVDGL